MHMYSRVIVCVCVCGGGGGGGVVTCIYLFESPLQSSEFRLTGNFQYFTGYGQHI